MTDGRTRGERDGSYTLYYEDDRGALLFSEHSAPYALYARHDGGVHFVDSGAEADELRALVTGEPARGSEADRRGPRTARRELRRRHRRSASAAGVSAVATIALLLTPGIGTSPAAGAERPTKLVQGVDIALGPDGALRAVTSTTVRNTDGETASETRRLDPAEVAADLPVRVLTSYVHDGRTGTDLSDLRGAKGRVEVTVTVQNTTLRTEKLRYSVAGAKHERFAPIGIPLTVTASAVLPKGALGRLVLPEHNARHTVTNGVVGRTEAGETTVQWAALLAPPRLPASTSFTLVQDTTDFQVPELDLSVQPGLVTDPSVDRLVKEAFLENGDGRVTIENETINLIRHVNDVLDRATSSLDDIRVTLADGADRIGSDLLGRLADSSSQLTVVAGDLSHDLDRLDADLSASLRASRDDNVAALQATVRELSDYIGRPDTAPVEALPVKSGCRIAVDDGKQATTLYAQLRKVSQQLRTLRSATGACMDAVKASLAATLGDPGACPPAAKSVACTLATTRTGLDDVATRLATTGAALVAKFDPTAVDDVRGALSRLTRRVADVQGVASGLRSGAGNDADDVRDELVELRAALDAAIAEVRPGGGLVTALGGLHDVAVDARQRIGGDASAAGSVSAQLAAAAAAVCDTAGVLPAGDAAAEAYVARLRALLVGTSCGNGANATALPAPAGYPAPIAERLRVEHQAWTTVAAFTDYDAPSPVGAAQEARALADALQRVRVAVDSLSDGVGGGQPNSLKNKLGKLLDDVDALYDASGTGGCPSAGATADVAALNVLATAFAALDCNQAGLGEELRGLLVTATPAYEKAAKDVGDAAAATNAARLGAASALDELLGTLNESLDDAADRTLDDGEQVVVEQQNALTRQEDTFTRQLDATTKRAVDEMAASIGQSNRQLADSTDLLAAGLRAVQRDLGVGDDNRPGLIGVVQHSADLTGAAAHAVTNENATVSAKREIRRTGLDDVELQAAQFQRALELHAQHPPFAVTLPPGSTRSVVFNFHLGGD